MKVLVSRNVLDVESYFRETNNNSNASKVKPFIKSEIFFDEMKLNQKNLFVDGENYNLEVLITMVKNLKPYKIIHLKKEGQIFYKTIFQSDNKSILVDGPLTSGYAGQGPKEFAKLLSELGIEEEILEKYIFTRLGEGFIETTFILPDNI